MQASAYLAALAAAALLLFADWIRGRLRREGGDVLASVAHGALIALAVGIAATAALGLALGEFADDRSTDAFSALNALSYAYFLPLSMPMAAFLLAVVRGAPLPRWAGWIAGALGVLALVSPVGFFGFIEGHAWVLVVSVLGAVRLANPELVDLRPAGGVQREVAGSAR